MKTFRRFVKVNICLLIIGILGIVGLYILAYFSPILDIKNTGQYYIYDKNSNIIYQGSGNTKWVNLEDVSPYFIDAIISIEDKNFYKHNGFDYLRIIKTLIDNFTNGEIVGGASTISQQYVKNLYLDFDQTWQRKIEEAWLTLKLEVHYEKDEILEGYINTINFGQGNFGVAAAAQYYFNKNCKDLTLEEAIILAGIPKSPSYFNPVSSYEDSIDRAKLVASSMVNNGYISETEKNNLFKDKLEIYGKNSENNLNTLMYYETVVKQELDNLNIPKSLIETRG